MLSQKKIIAIQPLGDVRSDVLEVIAANLQAFFQIRAKVLSYQPIPDGAYNAHRGQYNCYPILKFLGTLKLDHTVKIIGVTEVDLFIPILTYVFGEGELGGNAAVISICRLDRGKDWEACSAKRLFERAAKIAVHETAHTFRLPHCKEDRCIMNSFPVLEQIDEKPIYFCRYCVKFLQDEYEHLSIV